MSGAISKEMLHFLLFKLSSKRVAAKKIFFVKNTGKNGRDLLLVLVLAIETNRLFHYFLLILLERSQIGLYG